MDKFESLGGQNTQNYGVKEGGITVKFLLKRAFLSAIAPPITHFNTGVLPYYIRTRMDSVLTL